jgi:hypothetical protein
VGDVFEGVVRSGGWASHRGFDLDIGREIAEQLSAELALSRIGDDAAEPQSGQL